MSTFYLTMALLALRHFMESPEMQQMSISDVRDLITAEAQAHGIEEHLTTFAAWWLNGFPGATRPATPVPPQNPANG